MSLFWFPLRKAVLSKKMSNPLEALVQVLLAGCMLKTELETAIRAQDSYSTITIISLSSNSLPGHLRTCQKPIMKNPNQSKTQHRFILEKGNIFVGGMIILLSLLQGILDELKQNCKKGRYVLLCLKMKFVLEANLV